MRFDNAQFEIAAARASQLIPSDMPEIAFSGRSNVGKSSLINKLLARKSLARVSSQPGKTATINFYRVGDIRLCDLPGYGYAKVAKTEKMRWAELVEGYFAQDRDLRLVVQLVDSRHAPTADDMSMIDYLIDSGTPFIVALTKVDKLGVQERKNRMTAFLELLGEDIMLVPFSAVTGEGVEPLREIIEEVSSEE